MSLNPEPPRGASVVIVDRENALSSTDTFFIGSTSQRLIERVVLDCSNTNGGLGAQPTVSAILTVYSDYAVSNTPLRQLAAVSTYVGGAGTYRTVSFTIEPANPFWLDASETLVVELRGIGEGTGRIAWTVYYREIV